MVVSRLPQAAQEAVGAFDAGIGPFQRLVGRRGEHDEQAGGVGAVLVDQRLRVDAVVLRLRHLLGAADDHRQAVGLAAWRRSGGPFVGHDIDVGRVDPLLLAAVEFAVEGRGDDHALGQQVGEGFAEVADQADVAHQLGEEARIQQVQDGVLDAADVLVEPPAPVGDALVDHGRGVVRAGVAHEVPGRLDEGVHGVGFAPGVAAALRAVALVELGHLRQRRAGAGDLDVLGQHDRQLVVRHRHVAAGLAVDDRDRAAPVALARNAPVAQAELDLLVAEVLGGEVGGDGVDGGFVAEAVVFAGIDQLAALLVGVPLGPGFVAERGFAVDGDDLLDRQVVLQGEGEIALVVRRHGHHGAVAVAHQHVVADPDFDLFAGQRMGDVDAGRHALLFHRRDVGFGDAALLAFLDESGQFRVVGRSTASPADVRRRRRRR